MVTRANPTWYVISLRPSGDHEPLRRAAARAGGGLIALSPWRIVPRGDAPARSALRDALAAPVIVFTSPASVRAAGRLLGLHPRSGQTWCAVGSGTAAALRRLGVRDVEVPSRMDTEGLLALPALQEVRDRDIGLVTAPGGRGELAPALQARGARVVRADVYAREPVRIAASSLRRLREVREPLVLALSSGEAVQRVLDAVPSDVRERLRQARVVAASDRLAALARGLGFVDVVRAAGPSPRDLVDAARSALD